MKLEGMGFIRRFALHILPRDFVRIRHYGILSGTAKGAAIPAIRQQLPEDRRQKQPVRQLEEYNPLECPYCRKETMVTLQVLA
ncbi:transposase [Pontibacter korlensis]|uniref:transposase n=1 Tax=Pontibacter korlensis TaxID=400092 RepID=UPI000A6E35D1|nr:transposase [Pontibacter korlensis]